MPKYIFVRIIILSRLDRLNNFKKNTIIDYGSLKASHYDK